MLKRDKALSTEEHIQNYHFRVIQNNHKGCVLESTYKTYLGSMFFLVVQAMEQRISYPKTGTNIDQEDLCVYNFGSLRKTGGCLKSGSLSLMIIMNTP